MSMVVSGWDKPVWLIDLPAIYVEAFTVFALVLSLLSKQFPTQNAMVSNHGDWGYDIVQDHWYV